MIPGSGGEQGGAWVSPAKVERPRTQVKTIAETNLFRFFMGILLNFVVGVTVHV